MNDLELGLRHPKEIEIGGHKFIISKFPSMAGREIVTQYPLTALPKLGEYKANAEIARKMLAYVAVQLGDTGQYLRLTTDALIDNHTEDYEMELKLEWAILEYNCSFFRDGHLSTFFENFAQSARMWITKMLTDFSVQSSPKTEPPLKT